MDTYTRILRSAEHLFVSQGYERTTMDQIARNIDLSKGALYYFFRNKSDLFCRIVDDGLADLENFVQQCMETAEEDEAIALQIIQKYVDMAYDYSGIVVMILGGQVFGDQSPIHEMLRPRLDRLLVTIENVIKVGTQVGMLHSVDCKTAAKAFLGMIYGIFALPEPSSREETVAGICNLLEHGLYCRKAGE